MKNITWSNIPNRLIQNTCNCIGPQNNEPVCPCMMKNVTKKNGRWINGPQDLGPIIKNEIGV